MVKTHLVLDCIKRIIRRGQFISKCIKYLKSNYRVEVESHLAQLRNVRTEKKEERKDKIRVKY